MKTAISAGLLITAALVLLAAPAAPTNGRLQFIMRQPPSDPCVSATCYYVDPDYTGGTKNGQASTPWTTIDASAWSTINTALSTTDVLVYLSARLAGSDADQTYGSPSAITLTNKTTSTTHRLTLNGRSRYNTNDTTPSWSDYAGTSRALVRNFDSQNAGHTKYSTITLDGFRVRMSVAGKAVAICGDDWVVTNSDIAHTSGATDGPLILIVPTADAAHEGSSSYCAVSSDITISNNTIHDSYGELLYVGGGGCSSADPTGGAACQGFPSHDTITISGNVFYNGGIRGGQGDGVDVKGGLSAVTISGNEIYGLTSTGGVRGIVSQGQRNGDPDAGNVITGNYLHDFTPEDAGIALANTWGTPRGVEIRNNLIDTIDAVGIKVYSGSTLTVYNNTIYNSSEHAIFVSAGTVTIKNNIALSNNAGGGQVSLSGTITATHNAYSGTWSGTCTSCVSGLSASDLVNPSGGNFQLVSGSAAKDVGTALGSFATDYAGVVRPQGSAWDIGAYELP